MIYELNFNYNTPIQCDCQMFYKTGVLSAYYQLQPWLIQHCNNIFLTSGFTLEYGENGRIYDPVRYFESVLSLRKGELNSISPITLKNYILSCLQFNTYLIMECKFSNNDMIEEQFEECLIYGFDDNNDDVIIPLKKNGKWVRSTININDLILAYHNSKINRKDSSYPKKYVQYPITEISVNLHSHMDFDLHMYCRDIYYRHKYKNKTISCSENEYFWEGYNSCLKGILFLTERLLEHDILTLEFKNYFPLLLKKIWEYRARLKEQDEVLLKRFQFFDSLNNISSAARCIKLLQNAYMLALKYTMFGNRVALKSINNIYHELIIVEDEWLDSLCNIVLKSE